MPTEGNNLVDQFCRKCINYLWLLNVRNAVDYQMFSYFYYYLFLKCTSPLMSSFSLCPLCNIKNYRSYYYLLLINTRFFLLFWVGCKEKSLGQSVLINKYISHSRGDWFLQMMPEDALSIEWSVTEIVTDSSSTQYSIDSSSSNKLLQ